MAVGLVKNQTIRNSGYQSSPLRNRRFDLRSAKEDFLKEMDAYRGMQFKNPYSQNVYAGMENTMEDLTINQQQAQFQAQQSQQSQANILNSLTSGGRFNAGNVQALANQSTLAAQQSSASIGQQESQNKMLAAREASRLQTMERQGRTQVQSGEAMVQGMESDRQATMLGMSMQQIGNAQQAIAANKSMWGNIIGAVGSVGAAYAMSQVPSDKRLKKNIKLVGKSPSGLNIYNFEYKNKQGVYQGVMSDEIPQNAVVVGGDGYDRVNYNMLDVEFKQI